MESGSSSKCTCHLSNTSTSINAVGDVADTYWPREGGSAKADSELNVYWGDYKILKKCLVKRWEDITKTETCLHSLWAKRKNLEGTLVDSQSQLESTERALVALNAAINTISKEVEEQQQRCRDLDKEVAERQGEVDALLKSANYTQPHMGRPPLAQSPSPGGACPCRRLKATISSDLNMPAGMRALVSSVSGLKSQQSDIKRSLQVLQAQLNCKLSERLSAVSRKEQLENLIQQVTRNLVVVNEECENVSSRWKEYRCQVEKLQTQMVEQWGPTALDRLTPANASRSRFF